MSQRTASRRALRFAALDQDASRRATSRVTRGLLILTCGLLPACSLFESSGDAPAPGGDPAAAVAGAEGTGAAAPNEKPAPPEPKIALIPAPAWPAPKVPPVLAGRPEAPPLLGALAGELVVPMAVRGEGAWRPVELLTLDKLPEGRTGKDAAPEILQQWWQKVDLKADDVFILIGEKGARGTLKVKLEFAPADRGGCLGLVVAIPGAITWTQRPAGSTQTLQGEAPDEQVWALRAPWDVSSAQLSRAPSEAEQRLSLALFDQMRAEQLKTSIGQGDSTGWRSCDSVQDPPCKGRRAQPAWLDLEGDGSPELMGTIQVRAPQSNAVTEQRVLMGLSQAGGYALGRWSFRAGSREDESQLPVFAGALDLTGDGRAELLFRQSQNEVENWEIFESEATPGTWKSVLKTTYEGC